MEVLRFGSRGDEVEKWQHFLRGIGLYLHGVDGYFGADTQRATETFQRHHGLKDDGIVGNRTLGEAMRVGFSAVEGDPAAPGSLDVPAKPPFLPVWMRQAGSRLLGATRSVLLTCPTIPKPS